MIKNKKRLIKRGLKSVILYKFYVGAPSGDDPNNSTVDIELTRSFRWNKKSIKDDPIVKLKGKNCEEVEKQVYFMAKASADFRGLNSEGKVTSKKPMTIKEALDNGNFKSTKIMINNLKSLLKQYRRNCYGYPTTEQGLKALYSPPTVGRKCKKLLDRTTPFKDAWNNEFYYESDGKKYQIWSYGRDGKPG